MAVLKKPYELSVWKEELEGVGKKAEHRVYIIGAHDMTHLGRATAIKLKTKINGTHELTFQMIGKYFDSEKGDYVDNPFIGEVYAERKIKLYYKNKWIEFYVKQVKEDKKIKGILKTFTCQDSFIDELSRNGYGITFDEELYNNVEEIGTFTEEILEDSVWYYEPKNNWGDFTEYIEDKLYKIPVSQFTKLDCYKLNFDVDSDTKITNVFTGKERNLEMGDDQARVEGAFWDQGNFPHANKNKIKQYPVSNPSNDGYIYIPYTALDFCYYTTKNPDTPYDIAATEEPYVFSDGTYALSPPSVDPNYLIQFYAIPSNGKIEIDEAGLILDKEHIYFMTLDQWNENLKSNDWYIFKEKQIKDMGDGTSISRTIKTVKSNPSDKQKAMGNKIARYEGYLTEQDTNNIVKGKKIQISDRSEINISDEIDQYVTVYNNQANNYKDLYTSEDWNYNTYTDSKYRVCSKIATRQIVPQLARNFVQNGTNIKSTDGWSVMDLTDIQSTTNKTTINSAKIKFSQLCNNGKRNVIGNYIADTGIIYYTPPRYEAALIWKLINEKDGKDIKVYYQYNDLIYTSYVEDSHSFTGGVDFKEFKKSIPNDRKLVNTKAKKMINAEKTKITVNYYKDQSTSAFKTVTIPAIEETSYKQSFVNFGAISQEKVLEKGKLYCIGLGFSTKDFNDSPKVILGSGRVISSTQYQIDDKITLDIKNDFKISNSLSNDVINTLENDDYTFSGDVTTTAHYLFIKPTKTIKNLYVAIKSAKECIVSDLELFEVYTKGQDQFSEGFFKYSGRDYIEVGSMKSITNAQISDTDEPLTKKKLINKIIFEDDIMPGDTYEYQQYFIQRLLTKGGGNDYDTMGVKEFITSNPDKIGDKKLPLDGAQFTEDDYDIQTNYIDLKNCSYYISDAKAEEKDCTHPRSKNGVCMYQLYGYCPYRFETEKHCRKIRTLKGEKSNRFNLTQELSKTFECYPVYYTEHDDIGRIKYKNGKMDKRIFYITEKGNENKLGFRYHKNLSDISRTIKSDAIVTKLYVQDVDSDISRTGLCSIKTAEDNPSKDSFIIDLSYYITKGMLDGETIKEDLYGIKKGNLGYLKTLGFYNTEYDKLSNQIINLESSSYTELEANLEVNLAGIETAIQQMRKYAEQIDKYKSFIKSDGTKPTALDNYRLKYAEQEQILNQLVIDTFQTNGHYYIDDNLSLLPSEWIARHDINSVVREKWLKNHTYMTGILGQFNKEFLQIQAWKKERASYLKQINKISSEFYKKYEPYLKEGTWSDSNYLTDNAYYHGALEVAAEGAIPKVTYSIKVVDLSIKPEFKDYEIEVADNTFVEDEDLFGVNKQTGFSNRLKVLISELNEELDTPSKNSITVQNFTTQFEDLFKQVTVSVQSLKFNENIYKRSSNFTSLQNIKEDSLQGTLNSNNLTLLSTSENNIQLDSTGQRGSDINNHANQYKQDGQGIWFSTNGGQSWEVGVGPSGVNADFIKVGTLDAGKIRIADSGYIYFSWDKNGIAAYRDPQSSTTNSSNINDYALFNRYGLSLIKNNKIKLRTGYEFNGNEGGDVSTESTPGENVGFYLYNDNGQLLFETSSNEQGSAQLRLQGEIFATDTQLDADNNNGTIAVYLNNQSAHGTVNPNKVDGLRLFSALYQKSNSQVQNVFSVLRDSVYIGGYVYEDIGSSTSNIPISSVSDLPNSIQIKNAKIAMDTNGNLTMDFANLHDSVTKKTLVNYIASQQYKIVGKNDSEINTPNWSDSAYSSNQHNSIDYVTTVNASAFNALIDKVADLYRFLNNGYLPTQENIEQRS